MQKISHSAHETQFMRDFFSRAIESGFMQFKIDYNFYTFMCIWVEALTTCDIKICGFSFTRVRYKFQVLFTEQTSWLRYVRRIHYIEVYMLQFKMKICKRMCMRIFKIFASIKRVCIGDFSQIRQVKKIFFSIIKKLQKF